MIKTIRPYLTSDEIVGIASELIGLENPAERLIVKTGMVMQCVCDLEEHKWENCNDLYDLAMENTFFIDAHIINVGDIDKIVEEEFGIAKPVRTIIEELGKMIKDTNPQDFIKTLAEVKEVLK